MITVSENIFHELDFFAVSFALGILLVLVYDCLRIFRRIVRHGTLWISLEDLCYWVLTAFVIFAMLYQKNDGLIRGFSIGGIALGMILYNQWISCYTVRYITRILKKIIYCIAKAWRIIRKPFQKATRAVANRSSILARRGRKVVKYFKKQLKKILKTIRIGITKK